MKCSHCGENISGDMVFCTKCGYPVPTEEEMTALKSEEKEPIYTQKEVDTHTVGMHPTSANSVFSVNPNGAVNKPKIVDAQNGISENECSTNEECLKSNFPHDSKKKKTKLPIIIVIFIIIVAAVVGVCFALGFFDGNKSTYSDNDEDSKAYNKSKVNEDELSAVSLESEDDSSYLISEDNESASTEQISEDNESTLSEDEGEEYSSESVSNEYADVSENISDVGQNIDDEFKSLASYKSLEEIDASNGFAIAIGYEMEQYTYWNTSAFKDGKRFVEVYYKSEDEEFYGTFLYKDGYYYTFDDEALTYRKEIATGYWDVRHPVDFFFLESTYVGTSDGTYNGKTYTVDSVIQSDTEMNLYVDEYGYMEFVESEGVFMDVFFSEDVSDFCFDIPEGYVEV